MAELAARLGSIVTFDRRGDVVWMDDFESGLRCWTVGGDGTGNTVDLSMGPARSGLLSARMVSGSNPGGYAQLQATITAPSFSPVGVEISFSLPFAIDYAIFRASIYSGSQRWQYALKYDYTNDLLQYANDAGGWTTIGVGLNLLVSSKVWHTIKLVCDIGIGNYVRAFCDSAGYSLAGIAPSVVASTIAPRIEVLVLLYGRTGSNDAAYIDNVIITQNEP
jgi:hypothetical protein